MNYAYPFAFLLTSFSMPLLLVILGVMGHAELAAEIGIVHAATLALLYAFSANSRSLILNPSAPVPARSILAFRLVLLIPLTGLAYALGAASIKMESTFLIALLLRRGVEWLSEIHLGEREQAGDARFVRVYLALQMILLGGAVGGFLETFPHLRIVLVYAWALAPGLLSVAFIFSTIKVLPEALRGISARLWPHLGSTAVTGVSVYVFRVLILHFCGKELAGDYYTAFTFGGLAGNLFATVLGPAYVLHEQRSGVRSFPAIIRLALFASVAGGAALSGWAWTLQHAWLGKAPVFWLAVGLSMIGGGLLIYAHRLRLRLLQHDETRNTFVPDLCMNLLVVIAVFVLYALGGTAALSSLYLLTAIFSWICYAAANRAGQ